MTDIETERAQIRNDFMRRLFAVAISVGVGFAMTRMGWIKDGSWPTTTDFNQILLLIAALWATVGSWDGYLLSIKSRPLVQTSRFVIDITLVLIYMFLLITSNHPHFLLPTISFIFVLYVFWDFLSIRGYYEQYDENVPDKKRGTIRDALTIYARGFFGVVGVNRGPVITIYWTIYFASFAYLSLFYSEYPEILIFLITVYGLSFYRTEKIRKTANGLRGFNTIARLAIMAPILALALLFPRIEPIWHCVFHPL